MTPTPTTLAAIPLPAAPPTPLAELWRDFRRNRGAVIGLAVVGLLVFCALFANLISPYDPSEQYRDATLRAPSFTPVGGHVFLLGTDPVGRDVLSRLIHGTRLSLVIGLVSVASRSPAACCSAWSPASTAAASPSTR